MNKAICWWFGALLFASAITEQTPLSVAQDTIIGF